MIEIRETDIYHEWFESLKDKRTKARIDVRIRRVSLGTLETSGQSAKAFRNSGSIMDQATGCILPSMEIPWSSYYVAGINLPKPKTFNKRTGWLKRLWRNRK
jgi:hypothetical protein